MTKGPDPTVGLLNPDFIANVNCSGFFLQFVKYQNQKVLLYDMLQVNHDMGKERVKDSGDLCVL